MVFIMSAYDPVQTPQQGHIQAQYQMQYILYIVSNIGIEQIWNKHNKGVVTYAQYFFV